MTIYLIEYRINGKREEDEYVIASSVEDAIKTLRVFFVKPDYPDLIDVSSVSEIGSDPIRKVNKKKAIRL